ncbi:MAG: type II toxin-antitoxin system HicB family antitoxin [Candidatus Melainabacteria bacterium]|nr:type II toxin-antitoxin system HicB family antitoxin [Candidatus Melainabacteria bacterium]
MIIDYINAALETAKYKILLGEKEKFYAEIPICRGVWANGKTLEECRRNLKSVLEGWIIIRLQRKLPIPKIKNYSLRPLKV